MHYSLAERIEEMFYTQKYQDQAISWYQWENRELISCKNLRGVYLLAFKKNTSLKVNNLNSLICKEIIYIGETHGENKDLRARWKEFERAAKDGKSNHAGGREFYKQGLTLIGLYVAVIPVPEGITLLEQQLLAKVIERELLWEYGKRFHCRPKCNKD